jgi:hypothetical protein
VHRQTWFGVTWSLIVVAALVLLLEVHRHHETVPVVWLETSAAAADVTATKTDAPYVGNVNTHKFHRKTCRYAKCPNCRVHFHTRDEALQEGFRPCGVCDP